MHYFCCKETKKAAGLSKMHNPAMSFENIQLPGPLIVELYKHSLVSLNKTEEKSVIAPLPVTPRNIKALGNNGRHLTLLVNDPEVPFIQEDQQELLSGILSACGLSWADIALVNTAHLTDLNYKEIIQELKPTMVWIFGINPTQLQLPLQFPHYQVQGHGEVKYLSAPNLKELIGNREEKARLWNTIKPLFKP
jgi:DNA polymerase III psi subunit